jgi:hypothetical protein
MLPKARQTLEDKARQGHWGMGARTLAWTLGAQDEHNQREQLTTGGARVLPIQGLYHSKGYHWELVG